MLSCFLQCAWVQAQGEDTTEGVFDERMYHYAISPEAQESHHVQDCYDVLRMPPQQQQLQQQWQR